MSVVDNLTPLVEGEDDNEQKYWCTYEGCNKCYKQKRNLMIHVKLDHCEPEQLVMHECPAEDCTKTFKYKCALNRHFTLYHSGAEVREATLAKRRKSREIRVAAPNEEKKWRVLVGAVEEDPDSKSFACPHENCNRVFTSKGSLNLHVERKHNNPRAFTCPVETCGRQFSYKHVLQTHVERIHPNQPFNYSDYPNPKRQRSQKNRSSEGENDVVPSELSQTTADDHYYKHYPESSDADPNSEEDEHVHMETPGQSAAVGVAKRGAADAGTNKHSRTALGKLAEMAVRSTGLAESSEGEAGAGISAAEALSRSQQQALWECDHPGCNKVSSPLFIYTLLSLTFTHCSVLLNCRCSPGKVVFPCIKTASTRCRTASSVHWTSVPRASPTNTCSSSTCAGYTSSTHLVTNYLYAAYNMAVSSG